MDYPATVEPRDLYLLFGKRVAHARVRAEMTQQDLGNKVQLSRASIANIEAGRQRIVLHQAIEISEALSLASVAELLPTDLIRPTLHSEFKENLRISGAKLSKSEAEAIHSIVASS